MLNVVGTLEQHYGNVLITSESDVVTTPEPTSAQLSFSIVSKRCDNVNSNVVTTL